MRIVHLDSGSEMRGGQWQVMYLLDELHEAGHSNLLLAPRNAPLALRAAEAGHEVQPLGLLRLAAALHGADIVHVHDAHSHALAALLPGKPLVVARRVAFPLRRGLPSRWKYGRAARYIAVSQFVKRRLLEAGIKPWRISVIYDGVPHSNSAAGAARSPIFSVVAPATADPKKGSSLVEKAALMAGAGVKFSVNLAEDLPRASMFVYLTQEEGLGSAILLAMHCGVPVIASRVGGIPEAIEHGRTGLLTLNDPSTVAQLIRRLRNDPALAARLAANARETAEWKFSTRAMATGTLRVYEEVLAC